MIPIIIPVYGALRPSTAAACRVVVKDAPLGSVRRPFSLPFTLYSSVLLCLLVYQRYVNEDGRSSILIQEASFSGPLASLDIPTI